METPPTLLVTVDELKERHRRACELKQAVNWEKIVACFQKFAVALGIEVSAIVRVEGVEHLRKASNDANAAWDASAPNDHKINEYMGKAGYAWIALRSRGSLKVIDAFQESHELNTKDVITEIAQSVNRVKWAAMAVGATSAVTGASVPYNAELTKVLIGIIDEWIARAADVSARDARTAIVARDGWHAKSARDAMEVRNTSAANPASVAMCFWPARPESNGSHRGSALWDATWMSITAIGAGEYRDDSLFLKWYPLFEAFEAGALCFFFTHRSINVCTLPAVVKVDDRNRLHSASGPAFVWLNDIRDYYWHGVRVTPYVVENPECITVAEILAEPNVEVRRVKIERFGQARYLMDSGAQEVHRDDYGTLYRKEMPGDEPLMMVKVVNATPEPDGGFKDYFLRVPPTMRTAREAVAWTFGKAPDNYDPDQET